MEVFDIGNGLISSYLVEKSSDLSLLGWINSSQCVIENQEFKNAQFPNFRPILEKKIEGGLVIFGIKEFSRIDDDFLLKAKVFFEILFSFGFSRVLCLSSVAVYGDSRGDVSREIDDLNPMTDYGRNKAKIEHFFANMVPQSVLITRISNLFDLPHLRKNCFLDAYIDAVRNNQLFISNFDKNFERDFISFEFLIFCLSSILKRYCWSKKLDVLNVCSGKSISFGGIIERSKDLGLSPQVEYRPMAGCVAVSSISADKLIDQYLLEYSVEDFWTDVRKGLLR